jgi:hypothetical protein
VIYEIEFLDEQGAEIGDDSKLESDALIPIPNVGEVITAPKSGFFEVTARVFSYARAAGKKPTFHVKLYCKKTPRDR